MAFDDTDDIKERCQPNRQSGCLNFFGSGDLARTFVLCSVEKFSYAVDLFSTLTRCAMKIIYFYLEATNCCTIML